MTIHSDWARILHEECPEAFCAETPNATTARLEVGVIDGHLQLMCLSAHFQSWEGFLCGVFMQPIERLFNAGCTTVVMCFDSYDHVPIYKSMTQLKRVQHATTHNNNGGSLVEFGAADDLPTSIPAENTMAYLMNRSFKLKVIELACARLPQMVMRRGLLHQGPGRRFILDYKTAVEFTAAAPTVPMPLPELASLGESDIKFIRYVERFGSALVHAIDGDYMPIALLHYARHGLRATNQIFLLRHPSILAPSAAEKKAAAAAAEDADDDDDDNNNNKTTAQKKKRKRVDIKEEEEDALLLAVGKGQKTKKARPKKCWVDMQLLYLTLSESMRQSLRGLIPLNPRTLAPYTEGDMIHAAVLFMLCAGTDFSRSLPLVGPKRLWFMLPDVAAALVQAAPLDGELQLPLLCDGVVASLYLGVFGNHLRSKKKKESKKGKKQPQPPPPPQEEEDILAVDDLAGVMRALKLAPRLAPSTRGRLPTHTQVEVTLRNLEWVMHYWSTPNARVQTPLTGAYGYMRSPTSGAITFSDLA